MRTTLLTLIGLVALAMQAEAADFTGFYAGVNAGYALETGGRDRRGVEPGPTGDGAGGTADRGLPPSAQDASRALQSRNRASQGAGAVLR